MEADVRVGPDDVAAIVRAHHFDLGFVSAVANVADAGAAIDGRLGGTMTVFGSSEAPTLSGGLTVNRLRAAIPGIPPLEEGRMEISLHDRAATVSVHGRSGTGRVSARLQGRFPSIATPQIDGTFALVDVPYVAAGTVLGLTVDGQLAGRSSEAGVDGEVVLLSGAVRIPDVDPRALHSVGRQPDVVFREGRWPPIVRSTAAKPSPTRYTLRFRTSSPIELVGPPLQARLDFNLIANRRMEGASLVGDVSVSQGTVDLFGRRYTVERADVALSGRIPSDPRLDIRLSHRFATCTFFVDLVGSVQSPQIVLSAQPDIYDDKQLVGFLFGSNPDGGDRGERAATQHGIDLAAWLVLDQVKSRLRRALPFDMLTVNLGDGAETGQANVTLGKWLTDRLFVAYAYHHGAARGENTSEGVLRYRFIRSWLLEMVFGDRGNGGADVLWTKHW